MIHKITPFVDQISWAKSLDKLVCHQAINQNTIKVLSQQIRNRDYKTAKIFILNILKPSPVNHIVLLYIVSHLSTNGSR